jgi:hypothetical protein
MAVRCVAGPLIGFAYDLAANGFVGVKNARCRATAGLELETIADRVAAAHGVLLPCAASPDVTHIEHAGVRRAVVDVRALVVAQALHAKTVWATPRAIGLAVHVGRTAGDACMPFACLPFPTIAVT